jgi:CRISPR-associated endoribonuclease Cas6
MHSQYNPTKNDFSFQRVRLEFEALEEQRFPEGKAGNVIRGALGWAMREQSPEAYEEFFEPRQLAGPSGIANRPRPFVLRANHLDGRTIRPSEKFYVDLHLFRGTPHEAFVTAFEGIRPGRLRNVTGESISVSLEHTHQGIEKLTLRFVTPTELKTDSGLASLPLFPVVLARARDRIRALSSHEFALDFTGITDRSAGIALVSHQLTHRRYTRTSSKTGQTHPLGGFTGEAVYSGSLDEFLPLLQAAHWTGIGRQTVWGKGVIEVQHLNPAASQ